MLALVIFFLFDNLREKRSVPLTKQSGTACLKILEAHWSEIAALDCESSPVNLKFAPP